MSTDPQFAATVSLGGALLGATAETDTLTPAQTSVIVTAGTNGTKIEQVTVHAAKTGTLIATTVAGLVYLFLYDGSTYRLFDTITVAATVASTTAAPFHLNTLYTNLVLKSGWSLRASQSIVGNVSILQVLAFGGDL
jgi:tetrahydromethanopterin S-methyltransferase subunit D